MSYGLYVSAAGANAQSHRLEVLSHNLANLNTAGFKPHMALLQSRASQAIEDGTSQPGSGTVDDISGGVGIKPTVTQFNQGAVRQTGNRTDFAIHDADSFFSVDHQGKQLLTRAGNFMFDSRGTLVTPNGDTVRSTNGGPITINPALSYEVSDDGAIVQAGARQQMMLVKPRALGDLSRVGENLFQSLTPVQEVANNQRSIVSGALESSAVEPTGAMMQLIEASRVYEANIRMIQSQDESMGQLIGRVLRQS
jgi:flagellar basal-body rod protein FlgF